MIARQTGQDRQPGGIGGRPAGWAQPVGAQVEDRARARRPARAAVAGAVQQVSSDDVVQAASGIEQQARDVCKVNLGL